MALDGARRDSQRLGCTANAAGLDKGRQRLFLAEGRRQPPAELGAAHAAAIAIGVARTCMFAATE